MQFKFISVINSYSFPKRFVYVLVVFQLLFVHIAKILSFATLVKIEHTFKKKNTFFPSRPDCINVVPCYLRLHI